MNIEKQNEPILSMKQSHSPAIQIFLFLKILEAKLSDNFQKVNYSLEIWPHKHTHPL